MITVILKEHNLSNMHKGLADSFSLYRSKSKDTGSVSKSDYIKIAYLFIQFMMKKVIYDCDEIILPYKTGKLSVVGIKQRLELPPTMVYSSLELVYRFFLISSDSSATNVPIKV